MAYTAQWKQLKTVSVDQDSYDKGSTLILLYYNMGEGCPDSNNINMYLKVQMPL
jgi:hypothetical protein